MIAFIGTKAECDALQASHDKLEGHPTKGQHVGSGRHIEISDTPGNGWTVHVDVPIEHPERKGEWAYPLSTIETDYAGKSDHLSVQERSDVETKLAQSEELNSDWEAP